MEVRRCQSGYPETSPSPFKNVFILIEAPELPPLNEFRVQSVPATTSAVATRLTAPSLAIAIVMFSEQLPLPSVTVTT